MPENWKTYKFSELFETASGLSKSRDQFGFGSPFLTFKDVFYNYFIPPKLGDLANTSEKEQIRGSVKRGDIFLTRTSETLHELGMSSVALKDYPNATFNGFCKRLRQIKGSTVKIYPEFIGYFLRSNNFRNEVSQHATMTTRASLNNTSISSLSVTLPPFAEQVEISKILKPLDDKIELNLQMNKTLEEMAMALYKHWFVDFGPFQDGEFVESELGKIPKGWEVKKMEDIISVKDGTHDSPKRTEEGYHLITSKHIKTNEIDFSTSYKISEKDYHKINQRSKVDKDDILMTMIGTVGLFHLVNNEPNYAIKNIGLFKTSEKKEMKNFMFLFFNSQYSTQYIQSQLAGSTQQYLTLKVLRAFPVLQPPEKELLNFNIQIEEFLKLIEWNICENQTLTQLRDTLLPKLISGEVRVKDVEKTLSEVL